MKGRDKKLNDANVQGPVPEAILACLKKANEICADGWK